MKLRPVALALCALAIIGAATGPAKAETIVVDDHVQLRESSVQRPARGMTMKTVEAKFGTPASRHEAVGRPPITRWDYDGFAVFFEHDRVIHSVATAG